MKALSIINTIQFAILMFLFNFYPIYGYYRVVITGEWSPSQSYKYQEEFYGKYLVLAIIFLGLIVAFRMIVGSSSFFSFLGGPIAGVLAFLFALLLVNTPLFFALAKFIIDFTVGNLYAIGVVLPNFTTGNVSFENATYYNEEQIDNITDKLTAPFADIPSVFDDLKVSWDSWWESSSILGG